MRGAWMWWAAALATAVLVIAGCGSNLSTPVPGLSPAAEMFKAATASGAAKGYLIEMYGPVSVDGRDGAVNVRMSISPQTKMASATMLISANGETEKLREILTPAAEYVLVPAGFPGRAPGKWLKLTDSDLAHAAGLSSLGGGGSGVKPDQYLSFLKVAAAGRIKYVGSQRIGGIATSHYTGVVSYRKLFADSQISGFAKAMERSMLARVGSSLADINPHLGVWIGAANLVRRIQLRFASAALSAALTIDYLEYGPQPRPAVPPADETVRYVP